MTPLLELCFAELVSQAERYLGLRERRARLLAEERLTRERIRLYQSLLERYAQQEGG